MKLSNANSILICIMVLLTCIFMANTAMAGVCGGTPCVDSSDVINDSLTGSDINSTTSVDIDSLTVSDTVGIGTSSPEGALHLIPSNDEAIIIGDGTIETTDHNNSNKDGSIALTSGYRLCVCDGSNWVFASDGSTACQF